MSDLRIKEIRKNIIDGDLPNEYCEGCKEITKKNYFAKWIGIIH